MFSFTKKQELIDPMVLKTSLPTYELAPTGILTPPAETTVHPL